MFSKVGESVLPLPGPEAVRLPPGPEPVPDPDQTQPQEQPARPEKAEPKREKLVRQVERAWLQKTMQAWVEGVESELLDALLTCQPDDRLTLEENLLRLRQLLIQYAQQLQTRDQPALMGPELEDALLGALVRLLKGQAGHFLALISPTSPQKELEQLLTRLYRQTTGARCVGSGPARGAAALIRGEGAPAPSGPAGGMRYRPTGRGVEVDGRFSDEMGSASRSSGYPISPQGIRSGQVEHPLGGVALAERFARHLLTAGPQLSRDSLPFTSEERLGLELGFLAVEAEAVSGRPEVDPGLGRLLRGGTARWLREYLVSAAGVLSGYAGRHPPAALCPAYRLDVIQQIQNRALGTWQKTRSPEKAVYETLYTAFRLYWEDQEDPRCRAWLRFRLGRGFFEPDQPCSTPRQEVTQGWQALCRRWRQFLQDTGLPGEYRLRANAELQSIWGLAAGPRQDMPRPAAPGSAGALLRWGLAAAACGAAVCAAAAPAGGRAGYLAGGLLLGILALLSTLRR